MNVINEEYGKAWRTFGEESWPIALHWSPYFRNLVTMVEGQLQRWWVVVEGILVAISTSSWLVVLHNDDLLWFFTTMVFGGTSQKPHSPISCPSLLPKKDQRYLRHPVTRKVIKGVREFRLYLWLYGSLPCQIRRVFLFPTPSPRWKLAFDKTGCLHLSAELVRYFRGKTWVPRNDGGHGGSFWGGHPVIGCSTNNSLIKSQSGGKWGQKQLSVTFTKSRCQLHFLVW